MTDKQKQMIQEGQQRDPNNPFKGGGDAGHLNPVAGGNGNSDQANPWLDEHHEGHTGIMGGKGQPPTTYES